MTITLYGIPNCDQVKKARTWLDKNQISYVFHDFKKAGIHPAIIEDWLNHVSLEPLINRKGTTWRGLSDQDKNTAIETPGAIQLMMRLPSVIKRPVLSTANTIHIGFSDELYQQIFK